MSDTPVSEDEYQPQRVEARRQNLVLVSGCSGGGKSALLGELRRRGYQVFDEPGRQIVKEQLYTGGDALPWENTRKFMELVLSRASHQIVTAACSDQLSFFDRGIVDTYKYFANQASSGPGHINTCVEKYRYNEKVFVAPPWPEIYRTDSERRHSFADALDEYNSLLVTYERLGYRAVFLPKVDVDARADFVLATLALATDNSG